MAIIKKPKSSIKNKYKIEIVEPVSNEIKEYMEFIGIDDQNHFFTEAAKFVFSKDSEWKKYKKQKLKKS